MAIKYTKNGMIIYSEAKDWSWSEIAEWGPKMDMIEKMARAIFECDYLGTFKVDNGELESVWQRESYRRSLAFDQARAALSALQEPTDAMVEAGGKALIDSRMSDKMLDHQLNAAFTAMIKAAEGKS